MPKYEKIKNFIEDRVLGVFLVLISVFCFVSLISFSLTGQNFNAVSSSREINNLMGLPGSYFSKISFFIFGYASYLIPIFLFSNGLLRFFKAIKRSILLNLLLFVIGLVLLNVSLSILKLNISMLTIFIGEISSNIQYKYLNNNIIVFLSFFVSALGSLVFIFYSINIKIKFILLLCVYFFSLIKYFIRPLKKIKLHNPKNKIEKKTFSKNKLKLEPTINKTKKLFKGVVNKNNSSPTIHTKNYILPPISLLKKSNERKISTKEMERENIRISEKLESTLAEYGVNGKIISFKTGPVVTLFEFIPAAGIKTSKVVGLSNDIARAMSSISTRIASQPGKTSVGIEIPNKKRDIVLLGDLIDDDYFQETNEGLVLALGKNISGEKKYTNLEKMPHLLIAGTTGSGKSVGINSMIVSLLYKFTPSECKLILIDPKMLELSIYEDIPHLLTPVVTNPNKAVFALKWVVREMENRYKLMSSLNVKNITSFNSKIIGALSSGRKLYREVQTGIDKNTRRPIMEKKEIPLEKMPLIVVVIDEMADLMMVAGKEVENLVQRLAQMARASGIHIIAATQRPSVDVITGTIKANFPSRISFRVASRFDSRTILNEMGAEQLLGSGDMLFIENGATLNRVHSGYISEKEIELIVTHIKSQRTSEIQEDITIENNQPEQKALELGFENKNVDELYEKAVQIILEQQKVSTSFIQRYLQIGYNRAARIVEQMEEEGLISESNNAGKRSVLKKK